MNIHNYFELLALLAALVSIKRLAGTFMVWFIPYLLLTFWFEILADFLYHNYHMATAHHYNWYNLVSHGFYAFIFYNFSYAKKIRVATMVLAAAYILGSIVYFSIRSWSSFSHEIIAIGGFVQVVLALLLLYQYLLAEDFSKERNWMSALWTSSGILVFYAGVIICFTLFDYILEHKLSLNGEMLYKSIPRYLSVLLYSCISVALLTWKKMPKKC